MKLIVDDVVKVKNLNTLIIGVKGSEFNPSILEKINKEKVCVVYKNDDKIKLNITEIKPNFSLTGDVIVGIKFSGELEKEYLIGGEVRMY